MLQQRVESKWIDSFAHTFALCGIKPGDACAILCETQSRQINVQLAELALQRLGARTFTLTIPSPALAVAAPVRSTGASDAIGKLGPVIAALAASTLVVDCTVEGLQHAPELPAILQGGARVLVITNEHPEILERLVPKAEDEAVTKAAMKRLKGAKSMRVASKAGTDLSIELARARVGGVWGFTAKPGTLSHWPGGLALAFPAAHTVNGVLVLDAGDVNLTFKRYLQDRVVLTIQDDFVTKIEGSGFDAELMRGYMASWGDREAYAVSHVGWGLNPRARWDAMMFYDKNDFNGTELRAFAGNFLYSTGANEVAGRHTLGHFDLPVRNCTIMLDDVPVVEQGNLLP
jgi:2,5-dihydroxypyridine 5,6-dioxygenase